MLLLDTNALVWWLTDDRRLGRRAGRRIDAAWPDGLTASAMSWYELSTLRDRCRFEVDEPIPAMRRRLVDAGLTELDITGSIALDAADLDGMSRDPVDRMIVATARTHGATLVTSDREILAWRGELSRLDARR